MNPERDPEADDLFVDHLLEQSFAGRKQRDHAARITAATPQELAHAASKVDAASVARQLAKQGPLAHSWRWSNYRILLAVAALLLIAFGMTMFVQQPKANKTSERERAQVLLDDFHRVMPRYPANLRDAQRRLELYTSALPVLREIIAFGRTKGNRSIVGQSVVEFEIYAAVIGEPDLIQTLEARRANGDATAKAQLLTAAVITSDNPAIRTDLIARLAAHLKLHPQVASNLLRCFEAAELTTNEAEQLASAVLDQLVANGLLAAAARAKASPRRLLHHPIELQGHLLDDRQFSTQSLLGQPILVCYWATWCPPSLTAIASIERVRRRYPELQVVGISCDHDTTALRNYLADHPQHDWPQFFDRSRPGWHELAFLHDVKMVPFVLLIDAQGIVREVDVANELDTAVARVLGH